jgi:MFS family permease
VFIVLVLVYEASKFVLQPASSALLYESVDKRVVGRALSLLSVIGAIVQGIAASVAGYLLTWGLISHVLFATAVGALLLTILLTETMERRVASLSEAVAEFTKSLRGIPVYLARKDIVGTVAASALIEFSGFIAWLLLPLLLAARGLSVEEIGLVVGVSLIARRIGITVAGFVIDRLGPLPAMAIDAVSTGLLFAAIAVVKDP